jgi:hypothetical protein
MHREYGIRNDLAYNLMKYILAREACLASFTTIPFQWSGKG